MRRILPLALAGALLAGPALPAASEAWGATADPATHADGTRYCMLWIGEDLPLMNFTATRDMLFYTVVSDVFAESAEGTPVWFSFAGGTHVSVAPLRKPDPQAYPGFISGSITERALSDILAHMALGSQGTAEMTVRAGGTAQAFPLRSAAGDSALFSECRAKL